MRRIRTKRRKFVTGIVFVIGLCVSLIQPQRIAVAQGDSSRRTENFSADPGWIGLKNRQKRIINITENYGFRTSNFAGGASPGEVGGTIRRTGMKNYYGKKLDTPKTFEDHLIASGKFSVPQAAGGTMLFGWFNADTAKEWRTANSLVMRLDSETGYYCMAFESATSKWRADYTWNLPNSWRLPVGNTDFRKGDNGEQLYLAANGSSHDWTLEYDPDGNSGGGRIVFTFDAFDPFTIDLQPGHKADGATFTHFGMLPRFSSGGNMNVYFDDLVIDGVEQNLDADPGWEGYRNEETFQDWINRPYHDFGYSSDTNHAGGDATGEMGGLIWRVDEEDSQDMAYYADQIDPVSLNDPLSASGKLSFMVGSSDAAVLFGWFNSTTYNSFDWGLPRNFLGLYIEGPSVDGFFIRQVYNNAIGAWGIPGGPHIYPDEAPRDWSMDYDPSGNGMFSLTFEGETQSHALEPGVKDNAEFDRFGLISFRRGGPQAIIYFDDLTYTAGPPPPNVASDWTLWY